MSPVISVCVLSWNHAPYVVQCLQSICQQTFSNLEIVYLDNHSSDHTFDVAQAFLEKQHVSFQAFKRESPCGIAANFNWLLKRARGRYACIISADDWMAETNIAAKVSKIAADDTIAVVYSEAFTFYDDTQELVEQRGERRYEGYVFDELIKGNFLVAPGVLLDVTKAHEVGGFNEDLLIEDWDLWIRLSQRYKIGFVNDFLVYYRRHASNMSQASNSTYIQGMLQTIERYRDHRYYKSGKQEIVYQQFLHLTRERPGLKNIFDTLKVQDGSVYRFAILKHNFLKLFGLLRKPKVTH